MFRAKQAISAESTEVPYKRSLQGPTQYVLSGQLALTERTIYITLGCRDYSIKLVKRGKHEHFN